MTLKDIQIKIEGDSLLRSAKLKWGGSSIANEETKRLSFPARVEFDITGMDGKSIGHQFVIDSLQKWDIESQRRPNDGYFILG